jgi:hypothetical protein
MSDTEPSMLIPPGIQRLIAILRREVEGREVEGRPPQNRDLDQAANLLESAIDLPPQPHKMVCPACGMTRYLPDGWQDILGSTTIKCVADDRVMVER